MGMASATPGRPQIIGAVGALGTLCAGKPRKHSPSTECMRQPSVVIFEKMPRLKGAPLVQSVRSNCSPVYLQHGQRMVQLRIVD